MKVGDKVGAFGKKIGRYFLEEVETQSQSVPARKETSSVASEVSVVGKTKGKEVAASSKCVEQLKDAVLSKQSAFTQLLGQVEALNEVGLDEDKQYKAAFASLKKTGVTLKDILNAIEKLHLGILEGEQNNFDSEVNEVLAKTIGAKNEEAKTVTDQITEKEGQIAKFQAEVTEELKPSLEKIEAEIATQTKKLEDGKQAFGLAKQSVSERR